MTDHTAEYAEALASDYFSFMLTNRVRLRKFVADFKQVLTKPHNNVNEVIRLCDEFNRFRMEPIADRIPLLDEKTLDILDGAMMGKLNGFSIETILKHECYEHMRSIEEKPLATPTGPVLNRGIAPLH